MPLTKDELRQVLLRLMDCREYENRLAIYERFSADAKEMCAELVAAERERTAKEADEKAVALREAAMYKSLYESLRQKPKGAGYYVCKIFTLGISRCF